MRLDAFLAKAAGLSRKEAKDAVKKGRVFVDGLPAADAGRKLAATHVIELDGKTLFLAKEMHIMLYKPAGYLTAARDSRQQTVMDLFPKDFLVKDCQPVGRLDKDTEGLLLFTSDGELNHRLLAPKYGVEKTYFAKVDGALCDSCIHKMQEGIVLNDMTCLPAKLTILSKGIYSEALLSVKEGKFHQVKRMFLALGHEVVYLKRVRFGSLLLDETLQPGGFRALSDAELAALRQEVSLYG